MLVSSQLQRILLAGQGCPGNNESAGKRISSKIRKGSPWLRRMACQSAWAAARTKNTYLSAQFKKLAARRGRKCAIIAVAHSILVIGDHLQRKRCAYTDLGSNYFDRLHAEGLKTMLGQAFGEPRTLSHSPAAHCLSVFEGEGQSPNGVLYAPKSSTCFKHNTLPG